MSFQFLFLFQVEALDVGSLKRMLLAFEKKVTKNQEMRIKYPENPEKYDVLTSFNLLFCVLNHS